MKNIYKVLTLLLVAIMMFSSVSCGRQEGGDESSSSRPSSEESSQTNEDMETHTIDGTLHKVNVKANASRIFAENGSSGYRILTDGSSESVTASSFLATHIKNATGASLGINAYTEADKTAWTQDSKEIILNCAPIFDKAGLTMPKDNLGESGYYIKTVGNSVFIMTNGRYGYQSGSIKFLQEVVGYDMLSEDCVIYEKGGSTIPDMEIIEKPDYDFREISNKAATTLAYGMNFNINSMNDMFIRVRANGGSTRTAISVHNAYNYLPPEVFSADHPKWFYSPGVPASEQLCYTAHGDKDEYDAMVEEVASWMIVNIDENPTMNAITLTHLDNHAYCTCDACTAAIKKYGAITSTIIMFLNDVDDIVQEYLKEQAEENGTAVRKVDILFFAYHGTKASPTYLGDDGNYHPTSRDVVMNDRVGVFFAPIESYFTHSFYEDINHEFGEAENLMSWGCLTNNIYLWLYETHFNNYFTPYNTWDSMIETYRFCLENNGVFVWNEGQHNQKNPSCFSILKQYMDSKALFDVNANYADIEEKFFKNYFKEAYTAMYRLFKEIQLHQVYLENEYAAITGGIYFDMAKPEYFRVRMLDTWLGYIDEAYAAIEKYKGRDDKTYEMLHNHIMIESLFIRYLKLRFYSDYYSDYELQEARRTFVLDNKTVGNTQESEANSLSDLFSSWGF